MQTDSGFKMNMYILDHNLVPVIRIYIILNGNRILYKIASVTHGIIAFSFHILLHHVQCLLLAREAKIANTVINSSHLPWRIPKVPIH